MSTDQHDQNPLYTQAMAHMTAGGRLTEERAAIILEGTRYAADDGTLNTARLDQFLDMAAPVTDPNPRAQRDTHQGRRGEPMIGHGGVNDVRDALRDARGN